MRSANPLRRFSALVLSSVAFWSCAQPVPEPPPLDRDAVASEVATWLDGFWANWEGGGATFDRAMASFDDHPDFVFALDGSTLASAAAASETFRPFFQTVDHQVFEGPPPAIVVLGPDLVHVMQAGTFTQFLTDGTSTGPTPYVATLVLVRSGGGWKVRFIHQSTPQAAVGGL